MRYALLTLLTSLAVVHTGRGQPPAEIRAEILWDTFGIPHIFAEDEPSLFYAFGWAQMHSHGDLLLKVYGKSRGRGAEYWGVANFQSDRWVRMHGIPERAREWEKAQTPKFHGNLEAFVAGINAYAAKHADRIADEVEVVLPIVVSDVLAHGQYVLHFSFLAPPEAQYQLASPGTPVGGSNAWAIGPRRSATGKALLLANPHLPWDDKFLMYEAHLNTPGVNAYGAGLVGSPVLGIAFNEHLGWSHTVNTIDAQDIYELTLVEGGYRLDGQVRPFETEEQIIKVKRLNGSLFDRPLTIRRSVHGPVVHEQDRKAFAMRVAGLDAPGAGEQWWEMARAKSLPEFESAIKRLQVPVFTVMYADQDGHIMHQFGGRTPIRPAGNYNWSGILPGDTSQTLWTGTHAYDELPRIVDPPSGWLQNANDPPWTTTFPSAIKAEDFPSYMSPRFMHFRAQHSARLVESDDSMTLEEMIRYKHSTRLELADRILDDLLAAAKTSDRELVRQAADVLSQWDRCTEADSRGAALFVFFARELLQRRGRANVFAVGWKETEPRTTPRGLADPRAALEILEAAAQQVEQRFGALDVPWGEAARLQLGAVDLPANGGSGELGAFRVVGFPPTKEGRLRAAGGDSYVAAVEFSKPVRAMALLTYGSSSQPNSPHQTDQLPYFARKELRPVWLTRDEISRHLERTEHLE